MTREQQISVKQNTILVFTASTFVALVSGIFWLGGEVRVMRDKVDNAVSVTEMQSWEYRAEKVNPGWTAPAIIDIRKRYAKE